MAEQVERHDVQPLRSHGPGQRLLHPARHEQAVQEHDPLVARAVLGELQPVAPRVGLDEELADPLAHQHGRNLAAHARLTALMTAFSEAVTMLASRPTPHSTLSPTAHSTYAAAMASPPALSACSW